MTEKERIGVLVVRVWMIDRDPSTLRARITERLDLTGTGGGAGTEGPVAVVAAIADIGAAVDAWLHRFVSVEGTDLADE